MPRRRRLTSAPVSIKALIFREMLVANTIKRSMVNLRSRTFFASPSSRMGLNLTVDRVATVRR